ncbi:MAG: peptidoglycan-binding protein [Rhodospirillaceae bacterium]|nr:peptidoglycan-binding protein [Rhodospirillaceae bacterium]
MLAITQPIGRTAKNRKDDVRRIEALLERLGHLDTKPTDGATGYFGTRLEDAIKGFQKDNGLMTDGRINADGETIKALGQTLQGMGRGGDTLLAHLTPEEAWLLDQITDGGSVNPKTGLLEFWTPSSNIGRTGKIARDRAAEGDGGRNAREREQRAVYKDVMSRKAKEKARETRETREAETQEAEARERAAHQVELAELAKNARQREMRATMQSLAEDTERARRARALANADEDAGLTRNLLAKAPKRKEAPYAFEDDRATNQARQVQKARAKAKAAEIEQAKSIAGQSVNDPYSIEDRRALIDAGYAPASALEIAKLGPKEIQYMMNMAREEQEDRKSWAVKLLKLTSGKLPRKKLSPPTHMAGGRRK